MIFVLRSPRFEDINSFNKRVKDSSILFRLCSTFHNIHKTFKKRSEIFDEMLNYHQVADGATKFSFKTNVFFRSACASDRSIGKRVKRGGKEVEFPGVTTFDTTI